MNGRPKRNGLDAIERLKRIHRAWVLANALAGAGPLFAIYNKFQPVLTDGYGGDLLPTLLPDAVSAHYNLLLAISLASLALSELLRRRFHKRHAADLEL